MEDAKSVAPATAPKQGLRRTAVGRQAEQPPAQTSFPPGAVLLNEERQQKHVAYGVAIAALVLSLMAVVTMAHIQGREVRAMVLDRGSTIHIGPLEKVTGQSEVYRDLGLWATQVALQRSSVGFNLVEYVPMFFRPGSVDKLNADLKAQLPDLQARNLRQYPEIASYRFLQEGEVNGVRVCFLRVDGNIIRTGYYQGMPIAESVPFRLVIAAAPNPVLTARDKYPYAVEDYRLDLNPTNKE